MTPVELLVREYNLIALLRGSGEISAREADEAVEDILSQCLELEKQAIIDAFKAGLDMYVDNLTQADDERAERYYQKFKEQSQ